VGKKFKKGKRNWANERLFWKRVVTIPSFQERGEENAPAFGKGRTDLYKRQYVTPKREKPKAPEKNVS